MDLNAEISKPSTVGEVDVVIAWSHLDELSAHISYEEVRRREERIALISQLKQEGFSEEVIITLAMSLCETILHNMKGIMFIIYLCQ